MNALIALCHFCEQHGPRVLFCTQPFHEQEPINNLIAESANDYDSLVSARTEHNSLDNQSNRVLRRRSSADSAQTNVTSAPISSSSRDRCEGCRSLQEGMPGFISNDWEAQVRYVSSQQPHHDEVFSILRQACIRSLSSEVCPGREGSIFFGDSNSRYVLSYTFHLQDTKSRGGRRLYSFIVVMMDKIYLLNSFPFLVKHLKTAVKDLQSQASAVFQEEEAKCPTRAARLSNERSYSLPTQFRLQRNLGSAVRSLVDITQNDDLFKSLHLTFTWILKACSNRLTEKLLEGPPTEDSIVDLEKKEELVDDFVLVGTEKVKTHQIGNPWAAAAGAGVADYLEEEDLFDKTPTFDNLRELYQLIGYRDFHQLAHHVIIGNQIIVQADSKKMAASIIDCLCVLLPKGCCQIVYYSETYEDAWKCNFLGLSKFCELPPHVVTSEHYVLVLVESPVPSCESHELSSSPISRLRGYRIQFHCKPSQPSFDKASAPKILEKMERAVANMNLTWTVVEQCLICIKEEWMNKVKVLFTFTKAGGSRTEDDTRKLLQVFGATEEDKRALQFWMTGLSQQYKNHMRLTSKTPL